MADTPPMTTDIPALLKEALEALEPFEAVANHWHDSEPNNSEMLDHSDPDKGLTAPLRVFRRARKAATALREAGAGETGSADVEAPLERDARTALAADAPVGRVKPKGAPMISPNPEPAHLDAGVLERLESFQEVIGRIGRDGLGSLRRHVGSTDNMAQIAVDLRAAILALREAARPEPQPDEGEALKIAVEALKRIEEGRSYMPDIAGRALEAIAALPSPTQGDEGALREAGLPPPAYISSGPHLSGYRVQIGYETMADMHAAHSFLANLGRATRPTPPDRGDEAAFEAWFETYFNEVICPDPGWFPKDIPAIEIARAAFLAARSPSTGEAERGDGATTLLMQEAPRNALFIWCNSHLSYPKALAHHLGRPDLRITSPTWFEDDRWRGYRGDIVVDHAFWGLASTRAHNGYDEWAHYTEDRTRSPSDAGGV